MENIFSRVELLIGEEGIYLLKHKHVAIFGIGGVGSYVAEALVRAGIGTLTLIDYDRISISNINRQIHATIDTVGELKVEAMEKRLKSINPDAEIFKVANKYTKENGEDFFYIHYDYIVDAIDMVTSKIDLIVRAQKNRIPIVSSMGTGNKLDPTQLKVSDIFKTDTCPLAKVMRKELKNRGVKNLKVIYSSEIPIVPRQLNHPSDDEVQRRITPGSISFVPSTAGLIIASVVVNDLLKSGQI